jgi:membrane associated rhomboid family serine protease
MRTVRVTDMLAVPDWLPVQQLAIVLSVAVAAVVLLALDPRRRSWGETLRRRFLFGLPLGTLATTAFVLAVYLFVQSGLGSWYRPVTIPFRAWSYFYPLGLATAAFSHMGPGHLIGNLIGTLTLAPLVEYAWGHYPRRRGASAFSSWRTNPYVRALVVFPAVVVAVGLSTAVFAVGPIIGFSGVVFAFAGFALVYYPFTTVLALVGGQVLRVAYLAFLTPRVVASASPTFSVPWWAQIAIQGHALGLLVGVLVGLYVLRRRGDDPPTPLRLWTGVLIFGVYQSLWAVYWFRGGQTYVLFRAYGLALVVLLATLVTVAGSAPTPRRDGAEASLRRTLRRPNWRVGGLLLLLGTGLVAGPSVPVNLSAASDEPLPGDRVEVRDYEVTYAENVTSGMVSVVDVEAFGESTQVRTSGVLVRSERRGIWTTAVSKGQLSFAGRRSVDLGGVGWRERVVANRTGWNVVGAPTVYRVNLTHRDTTRTVYTSSPSQAEPTIAGRNVSFAPGSGQFRVAVGRNNRTVATAPLPRANETVMLDGVLLVRNQSRVYAVYDGTRVRVASKESYRD